MRAEYSIPLATLLDFKISWTSLYLNEPGLSQGSGLIQAVHSNLRLPVI